MRNLRTLQFLLSLALMTNISTGQFDSECGPHCKCIWASGKKTAECKHQNLTSIPNTLSSEVQHLDLTGNHITDLPEKIFKRSELDNLQKLILRECSIKVVNPEALSGLRIVIEIDLSNNRILQLNRGTFDETQRLRVLLLNHNRLQKLEDELFHDLVYLQKVEISDNHLFQIGQWTFRNLPGLQTLTLDGNNLTRLSMKAFENLPKLGSLELRRNPWNCDCYLKPFRDWSIQRKLYTKPTSCKLPAALEGRMWDEISGEQFACLPEIYDIGSMQRGDLGTGSAHLWCRATATPKPQISWVHHQRILTNGTKINANDKSYFILQKDEWSNLTISKLSLSDKGEYICIAKNFAGSVKKNMSLVVLGDAGLHRDTMIGLPLALGLGIVAFLFLIVALSLCLCYCRRQRNHHNEKGNEVASLDHGMSDQEKSLITAINPVVKPPRRYEAPSVTSHATEMTELNRTLLDNDSVFADGVGSVMGVLPNGLHEDDRGHTSLELDSMITVSGGAVGYDSSVISGIGTLPRNMMSHRQYPPDLLAFPGGRNVSPTSQASTAPDNSRMSNQFGAFESPASPVIYQSIGFKTLPHPPRASSATPYSLSHHYPTMTRHGYVTIPRRPRAPSWSSGPPISPTDRDMAEPVYDNLGMRTTADGSSYLSLCTSPELNQTVRSRRIAPKLPVTASSPVPKNILTLPSIARASPSQQLNRSAPEGASEWPNSLPNEENHQEEQDDDKESIRSTPIDLTSSPHARKVPPRPPPKPKKKSTNGPLYEDEGEDGTEV